MKEVPPTLTSIMIDIPKGIPFVVAAFVIFISLHVVGVRAEIDLLINGGLNRNLLIEWFV